MPAPRLLLVALGCLCLIVLAHSAAAHRKRAPVHAAQTVLTPNYDGGLALSLTAILEDVRKAFHVPGMAVGIVHKNRTVLLKGFGLASEPDGPGGDKNFVTPDTWFMLASLTKAFTSFATGILVSEGTLSWTSPIHKYCNVRFFDPVATERATLVDLLSHRTGLGSGYDAVRGWRKSGAVLRDNLEALEPTKDFRESWQYSNLVFHIAGIIAGNASSQGTWEELVQERILDPLRMSSTTVDFDESRGGDVAQGYYVFANGTKVAIPVEANRDGSRTGPSGVMGSTAQDMINWIRALLSNGHDTSGRRMLDEKDFLKLQTPHMVMPGLPRYEEVSSPTYGLGWILNQYRGHRAVSHGGNRHGFSNQLCLFPDEDLGIIILTNANANLAPYAACNLIADRILFPSSPAILWSERYIHTQDLIRKTRQAEYDERQQQRMPHTMPSLALPAYAGRYEHKAYGVLLIEHDAESRQLVIQSPTIGTWTASHWHFEAFNFVRSAPFYMPHETDALLSEDSGREMLIEFRKDGVTGVVTGLRNLDLERGIAGGVLFRRLR
ncbi:beta-lactamase/transpeptidase-like protein [Geranomyces variabilis]|nr:beta-lactamase/transpeptidase-like protein [Geranomyces variabilis]KAJ3142673.1 hypothetical protein HDU90_002540 [Geranomyces variabilis]